MKRRDLLKSLTMAAGGALLPNESVAQTEKQPTAKNPSVMPIRGLLRKDGKLVQPIQISIEKPGDTVTAENSMAPRSIGAMFPQAQFHSRYM